MQTMKPNDLKRVRRTTVMFMLFLVLSGLTAFPIITELDFLMKHLSAFPDFLQTWIMELHVLLGRTPQVVLYGTDWLAFAHLVIATFFIGVYIDPVKNKFIVQTGMIACVAIFPVAFICGPIRGIPFFHILIDCSFGVLALIPLGMIYKRIRHAEKQVPIQADQDLITQGRQAA